MRGHTQRGPMVDPIGGLYCLPWAELMAYSFPRVLHTTKKEGGFFPRLKNVRQTTCSSHFTSALRPSDSAQGSKIRNTLTGALSTFPLNKDTGKAELTFPSLPCSPKCVITTPPLTLLLSPSPDLLKQKRVRSICLVYIS